MNAIRMLMARLSAHYDKVLAVLAVAALVVVLVMIALGLGGLGKNQSAFDRWLNEELKPAHPDAAEVDISPYEHATLAMIQRPQIGTWSNSMFVPETRCYCVECKLPISMTATNCPFEFCKAEQPPPPREIDDWDYDGMPNEWEEAHGFNPRDRSDADDDADQDLFTNFEEFEWETDPRDEQDHPAYMTKVDVDKVAAIPFNLLFKSVIITLDGTRTYGINTRDGGKTYFIKMREAVQGFTLIDYKEKYEEKPVGGSGKTMLKVDVSTITLKSGNKLIELTRGVERKHDQLRARLLYRMDDTYPVVQEGGVYTFSGEEYSVNSIDIADKTVQFVRLSDKKIFTIGRHPEDSQ